jgi:uncharacterized membrane protein
MQTDGQKKSNKEKVQELEDKDILKLSQESSKTKSKILTDLSLLFKHFLLLFLFIIFPKFIPFFILLPLNRLWL